MNLLGFMIILRNGKRGNINVGQDQKVRQDQERDLDLDHHLGGNPGKHTLQIIL